MRIAPARWAALLVFACATLRAQSILTVAGGGPIGDGRPATSVTIPRPLGVAVDAAGNVYVTDSSRQRIRRVDAQSGNISTIAGGGSSTRDVEVATELELRAPGTLAFDRNGKLLMVEENTNKIRRLDLASGIISTVAGNGQFNTNAPGDGGPATSASFATPTAVATDAANNLYIADFHGHRLRRVDALTGIITTIAGNGNSSFGGDGGPATQASLTGPSGVATDGAGNIYILDIDFSSSIGRVRKISNGVITTIIGGGSNPLTDGMQAISAQIFLNNFNRGGIAIDASGAIYVSTLFNLGDRVWRYDPSTGTISNYAGQGKGGSLGSGIDAHGALFGAGQLTFDSRGNLYDADYLYHRVVSIAAGTRVLTKLAGGGPIGDGGPATSAYLFNPRSVVVDPAGHLYIADSLSFRIRKVAAGTGIISTFAGTGISEDSNIDGIPATTSPLSFPLALAIDSGGNIYIGDLNSAVIKKISTATGLISTVAGNHVQGFSGDGGPATQASISQINGLAVDGAGNLYLADSANQRIRKVSTSGIITTVAGNGSAGFSGDGGPAINAQFNFPNAVAVDKSGSIYVSDLFNNRIRKIDTSGVITTLAGNGSRRNRRANGDVATSFAIGQPLGVEVDGGGNVYLNADWNIDKVDVSKGTITHLVGSGVQIFRGDNGPALQAGYSTSAPQSHIALSRSGDLFIADVESHRIRAVFACVNVSPPGLAEPADAAADVSTSPILSWNPVVGAFRYDVYLDTVPFPTRVVGSDLTVTSFSPSNLSAGTRYYWRVVAKGDPFCVPFSTNSSVVRSFTTSSGCDAPQTFALSAPIDGATNVGSSTLLSWQVAAGASSYDVFLGPTNPPPLFTTTTSTSLNVSSLLAGTTYYWNVVARAACDRTKTTSTPVRSFSVGGGCPTPGAFVQLAPAPGATNVLTTVTLEWSPSANASTYDLSLGTTNPPGVFLLDLNSTKLTISGLTPGVTYYWRVAAKSACDVSRTVLTPISSFTVQTECSRPQSTSLNPITALNVVVGQTYVLGWNDAADLAPDGYYIVERSLTESFSTIVDSQQTAATSASFLPTSAGLYYHRVRPVNPCNLSQPGASSPSKSISVVPAPPNVIFTVQPQAVITTLGENLEDQKSRFVLENIGTETVQVVVGRQEINSPPFFTIVDPLGGDSGFLTLEPRKPKELEVRFSGPPNDQPAAYQGIIFLAAVGRGLAITPYAFVNLKVGGSVAPAPQFLLAGTETEYVFFPGFAGDDTSRASITVDVRNPGTTPMELGAEIGPEVWLVPESGWNSTAIPPGASRTVRLFTRRNRALHGSALPRYTYLTLRTKSGESARLLVQDNDVASIGTGRSALPDPSARSAVIPEVIRATLASGNRLISIVRLTNLGNDAVQAELFFTSAGTDGFDSGRVRRATILVPPNDVVTLTDPLVQLWGLAPPQRGQLEVRAAPEKIGLLAVGSSVAARAAGGGAFGYILPVIGRGEGARAAAPHRLFGISTDAALRSNLVLVETSGADRISVRVTLHDRESNPRENRLIDLPRYGYAEIEEVVSSLGGAGSLDGAYLNIAVENGGGSVVGVLKVLDRLSDGGSTFSSRSSPQTPPSSKVGTASNGTRRFFVPAVVNGALVSQGQAFQTTVGFHLNTSAIGTFAATYHPTQSGSISKTVEVRPHQSVEYRNILEQLFGVAAGSPSEGALVIDAPGGGEIYAKLSSSTLQVGKAVVTQALPVIAADSEALTSRSSQRPLYFDGLEQSVDPTRGTRWLLILNETSGSAATVTVRLYEAGNRGAAIAEKNFDIGALQQLKLDTVFSAMDLDTEDRRKDRTNVLVAVTPGSGNGVVSALAVSIDNRTGETKSHLLTPGSGPPGAVQKAILGPPSPQTGRRRPIRRGD